jgi:hypothetical protein
VGTRTITLRELEQAAALPLYLVDRQRDTILRAALQDIINEELLIVSPDRQGITVAQLLADASQSPDIARLAKLPTPITRFGSMTGKEGDKPGTLIDLQEQARVR